MVPDITNLDLLCPLRQPRDLTTISDSNSIVFNEIHGWQVRLRSSATDGGAANSILSRSRKASLFSGRTIDCCRFNVITSNNAVIDWQAMNLSLVRTYLIKREGRDRVLDVVVPPR